MVSKTFRFIIILKKDPRIDWWVEKHRGLQQLEMATEIQILVGVKLVR